MARYSVDIDAKISGLEKLDALERQIKSLKNETINVKINTTGLNNGSSSIAKQFEALGKQASASFSKGMQSTNLSSPINYAKFKEEQVKQIKDVSKEMKKAMSTLSDSDANKWASEYVKKNQNNIDAEIKSNQRKAEAAIKQQKQQIQNIQKIANSGQFEYTNAKNSNFLSKYEGQTSDALTRARKQVEEISKLQKSLSNGSLDNDGMLNTYEKLNTEAEKLRYSMKQVSLENSKTLASGVAERSANSVKSYYETNSKALKKYKTELYSLENAYKSITTQSEKLDLDNQFKNLKSQISSEGLTGKSGWQEFGRAFKQITDFAGVYGIIQNVAFEVPRQMVQAVRDINSAQIELTKVSNAPTSQLTEYWDEAADSAKKYGSTISDVISNTADWSRLGYGLDEAKKLSDATTLLQKVGDNMTQETSSSGLISTLKGFQLQADEAQSIVDKVNEVANTQPIDTAGIFSGLERSASSMDAANNSLEQTIALITAANSVVQDPDSVGTAFKTISMRIRGATTELEEAGLETDGMAESTAKLRKEVKALSGVDIMKNENTFKSTYDILDELSTKWADLTDIQQASITELIAGKRQGNIVSSLMSNFDIARETLNTAMNESTGSAERELDNWNQGINASISHFQAQMQELSSTTISSGFFKGIVDGGTGALNIITQLVDKVGILPTLLGGLATKSGLGKRNAVLYKAKQNYRRFANVENFVA